MSDAGKLHNPDEDVNDVPISPPGPGASPAKVGRKVARTDRRGKRDGETVVDTDANPQARPPGDHRQDAGTAEATKNLENESGGPTPAIGP
jgi:hypothetical protein